MFIGCVPVFDLEMHFSCSVLEATNRNILCTRFWSHRRAKQETTTTTNKTPPYLWNHFKADNQIFVFQVNLLCLLSHGMQQNSICNDVTLRATALSIVPAEQLRRSLTRFDSASLLVVMKWFRSSFCLAKISTEDASSLVGYTCMHTRTCMHTHVNTHTHTRTRTQT